MFISAVYGRFNMEIYGIHSLLEYFDIYQLGSQAVFTKA